MKYKLLSSLCLISTFCSAQQFTNIATAIPAATYSHYSVADYDSDGDMDVFVTGTISGNRVARIYQNNAGAFLLNTSSLSGVEYASGAWGDYDNDGDLDLFYCGTNSSYNPISKLYKNTNGLFAAQTTTISNYTNATCNWVDYDYDGDIDLFVSGSTSNSGTSGNETVIYQNNLGTFTKLTQSLPTNFSSISFADIDKDGDPDMAALNSSNSLKLFKNIGGVFIATSDSFASAAGGNIVLADADGNGYLDLFFSGTNNIKYYKNINGNSFVDANINMASGGGSTLYLADFDDDGDVDLLRHSGSSNLTIFGNVVGSFSNSTILKTFTGTNGNSLGANIIDVNGDSKIDVQIIYGGSNNVIFRNDNLIINTEPIVVSGSTAIINSNKAIIKWNKTTDNNTNANSLSYNVRLGTVPYSDNIISDNANSANGKRELLQIGNASLDTFKIINNLPQGRYYYQIQAIDESFKASAFSTIDSFEVQVANLPTQVYPAFNQDEIPSQFFFTWLRDTTVTSYFIDVASDTLFTNLIVNNVQTPDTFFAISGLSLNTKYFWRIRANNSFGTSSNSQTWRFRTLFPFYESLVGIQGVYNGSAEFADYDNDGDIDYLIAGRIGNTNATTALKRKFGNTFTNTTISFIQGCIGTTTKFFDYDNDNDLDAFVMGREITNSNNNYSRTIVNNTTQIGSTSLTLNNYGLMDGSIDFADYDNDGDLDAALFGKDAPYNYPRGYYFTNTGKGSFLLKDSLVGLRYSSCAWGDYDNDGDADLITAGQSFNDSAQTILYKNDNGNLVRQYNQPFVSVSYADVNWGDFDNDGDLDLLIGGYAQNAANSNTRVYQNTNGIFSLYTDSIPTVYEGATDWVDYDSDGDLDIFLMSSSLYNSFAGSGTYIAKNTNGNFTIQETGIPAIAASRTSWADYDDDGDLDLLLVSAAPLSGSTPYGKLFVNRAVTDTNYINTTPQPPTQLSATTSATSITMSWNNGSDNETPSNALSYNVMVGNNPYFDNISSSNANKTSGFNRLAEMGNAQLSHTKTINNLPYGNYFYCVSSVDQQYKASTWKLDSVYIINPTAPTLSYPYNTQQSLRITNQMRWKPFANAISYNLEIAFDSLFTNLFATHYNVVDTFYTQTNFINYNKFYWRVSANMSMNVTTPYSLVWSFFVDVKPILSSINLPSSSASDFDFGDIDNDGDMDYLFGDGLNPSGGHAYVLRNNQTYFDTLFIATYNGYAPYGVRLKFADINNDNKLDFIASGDATVITRIYYNTGTTFVQDSSTVIQLPINGFIGGNFDFGDYDNDGDLDLLCSGVPGTSPNYVHGYPKVWRNNIGSFTGMDYNIHSMQEGDCKWVDIDNDGDLDMSMHGTSFSNNNSIISRIYRNDVDSFRAVQTIIPNAYLARGSMSWADYDLDGDADMLMVAQNNGSTWPLMLYKNNGNFNFSIDTTVSPPVNAYNYGEATWGDYDNDGDPDILLTVTSSLFNDTAIADVLKNNQGRFERIYSGMKKVKYAKCMMVDVDNDHDLDLFYTGMPVTNNQTSKAFLYINQSRANTQPGIPQGLTSSLDSANNVVLSWNRATDNETPSVGLTYNVSLTSLGNAPYNITPMSDSATNNLHLSWQGNAGLDTFYVIKNLPNANYQLRVQAVDNTFEVSAWSAIYAFSNTTVSLAKPIIEGEFFTVYPNPASINLNIDNGNLKIGTITIQNTLGEIVYIKANCDALETIDVSSFSEGIYFVRLGNEVQKFVKE
jgi:hypothetical protein